MLGQFEASLRRRGSGEEGDEKLKKHSCCSGHAHGHGVRKERSVREVTRERREEFDLETGRRRSWVESREFEVLDLTGEINFCLRQSIFLMNNVLR